VHCHNNNNRHFFSTPIKIYHGGKELRPNNTQSSLLAEKLTSASLPCSAAAVRTYMYVEASNEHACDGNTLTRRNCDG